MASCMDDRGDRDEMDEGDLRKPSHLKKPLLTYDIIYINP